MSKGQATKDGILAAALQTASTVGFNALSIGGLAEQTGMSKSGLFAHFRSKEQLQLDTLTHARELFIDTAVRPALLAPRGEQRVRALFDGWLRWAETLQGGCVFTAAAAEFDDQPGAMRDAVVQNQYDYLELIARIATDAVKEGDFRADLDPELFAFQVHALELAYNHDRRLLRDARAAERVRAASEALLRDARTD